jgi:transcriptional regulator with XRE-family HTH domain
MKPKRAFGTQLREWRQRRHLSQLDLATEIDISARHLSFVETGRSQPSRCMVLKLAESLDVPLRERCSFPRDMPRCTRRARSRTRR